MKYIFYSDIKYIINKRKILLLLLFIVPFILFGLNFKTSNNSFELLQIVMATNVDYTNSNFFEITVFLFNICLMIFLISDVYLKDIDYNLENIFLRMKPIKWFLIKTISFITVMFAIKFIQYFLLCLLLFVQNIDVLIINNFVLFFCDLLYHLLLQYQFLLIYVLSILIFKSRMLAIILFVVNIFYFTENIWSLNDKLVYVIIFLLLINIIIITLFSKFNKNIIEYK